jgi:transcriptional regulator with XRE-family HTH domain
MKLLKKSPRTEDEAVWDRKIGAALAFIRNRDAQQTQAMFAKRMGISRSLLANIERGRTPLTVSVGVNACRIFAIDPLWLCQGGKGGEGSFPQIHADKLEKIETHLRAVGSAPLRDVWPSLVWFIKEAGNEEKKEFDSITSESNTEGVNSEARKLRDDLKQATAKPGMKAALARFMKVDPPRVSEWLAGQEPSGGYALKLRLWADEKLGRKRTK